MTSPFPSPAQTESGFRDNPRRNRKLSEKGRAFEKSLRKRDRDVAYRKLKAQMEHTRRLCDRHDLDKDCLEAERTSLDALKDKVNEAHYAFEQLAETSEEKDESYHWYDTRDREFIELRMRVCERMQAVERADSAVSRRSNSKSSVSSATSSARSVSLAKANAAAKTAQIKVEMEFLERENEVRRLQLDKEYALAKAREDALKAILNEECGSSDYKIKSEKAVSIKLNPEIDHQHGELNPNVPPFVPKPPCETCPAQSDERCSNVSKQSEPQLDISSALNLLVNLQEKQTELSTLLINQHKTFHLPIKEPPTFSGESLLDYPAFVTAFDSIIADKVDNDRERLFFLEKYTTGKANEAIKGFLAIPIVPTTKRESC